MGRIALSSAAGGFKEEYVFFVRLGEIDPI